MTEQQPSRRGPAIVLAIACLCLPMLAPTTPARAQEKSPSPSAGELWRQYPLQQSPRASADGTAVPPTPRRGAARVQTPAPARTATARPAESSSAVPAMLWLVLALMAVAAVTFVVHARRRRGPGSGKLARLAGALNPASGLAVAPGGLAGSPWPVEDRTPVRLWQARGDAPPPGRRNTPPRPRGRTAHAPPDRGRDWIAEVDWNHDEGSGRFQVLASDSEGTSVTIGESGTLEWPPSGPDSVHAMSRAADELEAAMLDAGWKPLPPGEAWYAKRFVWRKAAPREAPSDQPQQPRPAPPPAPAAPPRRAPAAPPVVARPAPAAPAPADHDAFETGQRARFVRVPWPKGTEDLWRCELRWHAGYLRSHFEAVALEPGRRRGQTIGRSETFKWLLMGDPTPQEFQRSVDELTDALAAAGWERAADGADWYSRRFVWRRDAPPDRLDAGKGSAREARK